MAELSVKSNLAVLPFMTFLVNCSSNSAVLLEAAKRKGLAEWVHSWAAVGNAFEAEASTILLRMLADACKPLYLNRQQQYVLVARLTDICL
jgi:hypothetical protein